MDAEAEQAFREFVVGRSAVLQRSAYLLTGDREEAKDAVQAALVRVYLAWPRIQRRDAVEAYTRKVLLREVLSWRRRRRLLLVPMAVLPEVPARDAIERIGEHDDVVASVLQLPPRQRAVVVLRYYDDLSEAQTAAALGITVGAVKTHASRGLARLRALLADDATEPMS